MYYSRIFFKFSLKSGNYINIFTFTNIILTGTDFESEGKDRATLELPGKQATLLQDAVRYGEINFDKRI